MLESSFPESYGQARERFLKLVRNHGASARTYVEPGAGPNGEELATDIAWFGDPGADAVMVMTSATHGVEGFCGSAAQIDFLLNGGAANLPDHTAALLVHAINPYGFAWLRRVTQEGVDLNRNSVDFNDPPDNPEYARLKDVFRPKRPGSAEAREAAEILARYRAEVGETAFAVARLSGQHVDPKGVHYGGAGPTWSRNMMHEFIADFDLPARQQVAVIDYHTGLGPHGYGEPICGSRPNEPGAARGRRWYGESMTEPMRGTSSSVVIPGLVQYIWLRELGPEALTFIALEFGTFRRPVMEAAVDAEHWLHIAGELPLDSGEAQAIMAEMRRAYFPDTSAWKEMVLWRSRQVIRQTLEGLASEIGAEV
jgi:Protein of unknown function (DUF2817)